MASVSRNTSSPGFVKVDLVHKDQTCPRTCLGVLKDVHCDILLGHDFQKQHQNFASHYGGNTPKLEVTQGQIDVIYAHFHSMNIN